MAGGFLSWAKKLFGKGGTPNYADKHLASEPEALGGATANEVFKTTYANKYAMGGETTGYFKPDGDLAPARNAVGASRLAQGMGLSHLIPETRFADHTVTTADGNTGVLSGAVSKQARGEALSEVVYDTDRTAELKKAHEGEELPRGQEFKDLYDGFYVQRGDQAFALSGTEVNDIDLRRPETQKGLNHLQWFDALIGNADRHGGNVLVDPITGAVSGIDNDMSFGKGHKTHFATGQVDSRFTEGADDKYLGLPSQIDAEMANKLLGLSPKSLKKMLAPKGEEGRMTKEELEQTYQRLAVIQSAVTEKVEADALVSSWDDTTYDAQINESRAKGRGPGSYLQRHHQNITRAVDPTNPDKWRKGHRAADTSGGQPLAPPVPSVPPPVVAQVPPRPVSPNAGRPLPVPPRRRPPEVPSRVGRPKLSTPA